MSAPREAPAPERDGPEDPWSAAADLVDAARTGDVLALDALLEPLAPYVAALCRPIAPDHSSDAAQEALNAVFQGLPRLRDSRALYARVRTITVREAVRVARRAQRETPVCGLDDAPRPGGPEPAADVRDVLGRMSAEHRAVLVLRGLEGLDERSVSRILGISRGTVRSRLHRARRGFRTARSG
ncbi:RNA polymerase sigma factor [Streptomyces sp. NPDC093586]|uniref:RNA polymerase sigma factor n=1 Tax=Streptomyces sp. NPDC093586 TaxID=3366042 RepID=UPI0038231E24